MKRLVLILLISSLTVQACGQRLEKVRVADEFADGFYSIDEDLIRSKTSSSKDGDGYVEFEFTSSQHRELLEDMEQIILKFFKDLEDSKEEAYIIEIDHDQDFSSLKIIVDGPKYKEAEDYSSLILAMYAVVYRSFAGLDPKAQIQYIDRDKNIILEDFIFPEG